MNIISILKPALASPPLDASIPDRRFILGTVTRYQGPGKWVYEIAETCFCGDTLYFHPGSQAVELDKYTLGQALKLAIPASKWYAMDTEFKLDQPAGGDRNGTPIINMKQARPYPGFGN